MLTFYFQESFHSTVFAQWADLLCPSYCFILNAGTHFASLDHHKHKSLLLLGFLEESCWEVNLSTHIAHRLSEEPAAPRHL